MALPTYGLVSFTVRDPSGNPIAAARVTVRDQNSGAPLRLFPSSAPLGTLPNGGSRGETVSDANGLVTFYAVTGVTIRADAFQALASTGAAPVFQIFDIQPGQNELESTGVAAAKGGVVTIAGSRALTPADHGQILVWNNGSGANISLAAGLPTGFFCHLVQLGAGALTVVAAGGCTFTALAAATHTSGANALGTLRQLTSTTYLLSGSVA